MEAYIIDEGGYMAALYGMGLSFGVTSKFSFGDFRNGQFPQHLEAREKMHKRSCALAGKGAGHDKFLRQVSVWMWIKAPLFWWKEFDQYKVGTVTTSESTMHTLMKRPLTREDFEGPINWCILQFLNARMSAEDFDTVNRHLPHSFLQGRVVSLNYEVINNIIKQRSNHKLPQWHKLIDTFYTQCKREHLLPTKEETKGE